MADYQEFRKKSRQRRMKKRILAGCVIVLALGVVGSSIWLAVSGLGLIHKNDKDDNSAQLPDDSSVAVEDTAPEETPDAGISKNLQLQTVTEDTNWNTVAYTERTLDYTVLGQDDGTTAMDYRLVGQPACGRIETSYYDGVTFMGDSLTQGLELYTTGLPNAFYCAYKGIGPNAVVNGATCKRLDGTQEVPLEALAAMAPEAIYVLFGTNTLTNASEATQQSFLAYYDQMIDLIKQTRPGIKVYMQSITPVRPNVAAEKPGLNNVRLQRINDELAALALRKDCYFINLWEPLADTEGNLREEYAAGDGIHMNPMGYAAWVEYLRTHTEYTPGALYELGSGSYYIPA